MIQFVLPSLLPLLLSLMLGLGAYLLFASFADPQPPQDGQLPTEPTEPREWDRWLARVRELRGAREFLVRAGLYGVTPREFVVFSLATGVLAALVAQIFLTWGVVTALAGALGLAAPFAYYLYRHDRRRAALQDALAEAIAYLSAAIRTGLAVHEACVGLAKSGPAPLRAEFARLVRHARLDGFEAALTAMQARLADPVFDCVAVALCANDRLGGRNVTQLLDRLAHTAREQLRIEREIRAYQARNVFAARIVAAIPLFVLVVIRRVNPSYLVVFDGARGQLVLAGCLAGIAVGYLGMLWTTRLPSERRVLR